MAMLAGLVRLGADPNVLDEEGSTVLHHASQLGNLLLVRYLVEQCSSDPMRRNDEGLSSLDVACGEGHLNVVQFFVEDHACSCSAAGPEGYAAFHWAVVAGKTHPLLYTDS